MLLVVDSGVSVAMNNEIDDACVEQIATSAQKDTLMKMDTVPNKPKLERKRSLGSTITTSLPTKQRLLLVLLQQEVRFNTQARWQI